uniref:DNA ligase n=1 Tax=Lygus hesperus TaxID=30085 RepID=A0A0A9ZJ82_LYGHE
MFSSNLTLKATMLAEKVKEKEDNRLAGRYVKIRALLDEAEKAINSSNISRSLKNKLMAKHVKARKALDTGLNVEEVIEMMTLIVSMINQEIRQDKSAIDTTTMEMRRNLDTFYNVPRPKVNCKSNEKKANSRVNFYKRS